MSRRKHLGCLNKNNSSGSSEFIHHPDIAGFRQGWISLEQNPWTFVDTYRVGIFAIALLQFKYLVIRCTQSTFQHSWLEHLLLLKMHVHCLLWYLGICVRRMIHDWNWSKGYPGSWALKKDPSITMLPNFRWLSSSLHVSSKMEEQGASKGATGSMIKDVLPINIFSQHGIRPSSFTGLRSAHRLYAEDL